MNRAIKPLSPDDQGFLTLGIDVQADGLLIGAYRKSPPTEIADIKLRGLGLVSSTATAKAVSEETGSGIRVRGAA